MGIVIIRGVREGIRADARHTISNSDLRESIAIIEGIRVDACDTIRNRDLRESRAIIEGTRADARTARDYNRF